MSSKLQDHKQLAATTIRPEQIIAPDLLLLLSGAFFTGSFPTVPILNLFLRARGAVIDAPQKSHLHLTRSSDQLSWRTPRRTLVYEA